MADPGHRPRRVRASHAPYLNSGVTDLKDSVNARTQNWGNDPKPFSWAVS